MGCITDEEGPAVAEPVGNERGRFPESMTGDDHPNLGVADRGPGIPEEDLERVFDKFQRVTRASGASGTGLGLAISRGIVAAHGGRIVAEARAGGGLEMKFALPLNPATRSGA